MEAIETAGYAGKCTVGLDVAASEFKVKDSPAGEGASTTWACGTPRRRRSRRAS